MSRENRLRQGPLPRTRGSVLLYVAWGVMLLSIMAAGIGSQVLFALKTSERLLEQLRAGYIARAAVLEARRLLAQDATPGVDGTADRWRDTQEQWHDARLLDGVVSFPAGPRADGKTRYGLTDEDGKINVNTAPVDVLQRLLETAGGLRDADAEELAAAIADWRDPDTKERSFGAEGFYYRSLTPGYDCADDPLDNLEELLLIRGMTPAVFRMIAPHVTVYGSGRLNLNTAGPVALRALGLSQAGEAGYLAFRAGDDSSDGTGDERAITSISAVESDLAAYLPVDDLARLMQLANARVLTTTSEAFRAVIQARAERPTSRMTVTCVMDRKGRIAFWSEQ